MRRFNRVVRGLAALFRQSRAERELDAELGAFFESAVDDHMRKGLRRDDAVRAARLQLGSVAAVKDSVRDAGWESVLFGAWQDLRFGVRLLGRSPGFTATAIGVLTLGIGATTAIFTLVDTLTLRPLPVSRPRQLVELLSHYPGEPRMNGFSWQVYERFRDGNHVFSNLFGIAPARFQVGENQADTEALAGGYVTANFFTSLGLDPAIGRLIGPADDRVGAPESAIVVLSWPCWSRRFNSDPQILARRITVNGVSAAIVGVAPRTFTGLQAGARQDLWLPAAMEPLIQRPSRRLSGQLGLGLMGRLKEGETLARAAAEMSVLDRWRVDQLVKANTDPLWRQVKLELEPAAAGFSQLREYLAAPMLVVLAVVVLLLLIGCANVASMLLARAAARRREMAVRISLGASRMRLVRQLLTESLILSIIASVLGLLLAYAGARGLIWILVSGRSLALSGWGPIEIHVQPDIRMLVFAAGAAIVTALLFGTAPAVSVSGAVPASALREGRATSASGRRFGQGLVVAQVALSLLLLTAAGLFVGRLSRLRNDDLGFERAPVLLVTLNPQGSGYDRGQLTRLYQDLLGRLSTIPLVRSATVSGATPIEGAGASRFARVEGFEEKPEDRRYLAVNWIGPRYFETFGTPLMAGRDFEFADAGRPRVAIVNQAMARHYFPGGSPIGKHLIFDGDSVPYEIVALVGDAKYTDLHERAPRTVYLNAFQEGRVQSQFALRTASAPRTVLADVRRSVAEVLPRIRVARVTTLADQIDASIVPERLTATLCGLFGGLGTLLAAVGLYGLLAYAVSRRTNEIGVRMALGASERDIAAMVLRNALTTVSVGLAVGVPLAWWARRLAASRIENLPADGAQTIAVAAAVLIGAALLASYVPARRAARIHPVDALRES